MRGYEVKHEIFGHDLQVVAELNPAETAIALTPIEDGIPRPMTRTVRGCQAGYAAGARNP